jgi:cell division protein FtsW
LNDSARWVKVFGVTFQPMEIAKLGLVMMTAKILAAHQEEDGTSEQAFGKILKYSIPPILIILKENFSSAALITFTIFLMMFVGRVPKHQLLKTMGVGAIIGIVGFAAIMSAPESIKSTRFGSKVITWQHRFEGALRPRPVTAEEYDMNENEQRTYSHIAIASSHIIGRGPGNSIQRDFIPHAYSDYIFAVIIEELGLLGATFVILLYLTLLYTCGKIAKKCDDPYMAFLSIGTGMMITTQALLHMFISVSNFVTGQPLPLMSQGGTSFLINCIYIGFLLCISRYVSTPSDKVTSEPQSV